MKSILRKLFKPLLDIFEQAEGEYVYKPLNRKILIVVGVLFSLLGVAILIIPTEFSAGFILPLLVFFGAGITCLVVGILGTDKAVTKIWGNK